MKVRKNQKMLTQSEWDDFVDAFKAVREGFLKGVEKPTLDDFADEHAAAFKEKNEDWLVHSHFEKGELHHRGLHFLAWHRVFLNEFENRLRREVPGVTIPYWNALLDPVPEELKPISDDQCERVDFDGVNLKWFGQPDNPYPFNDFQFELEWGYHNQVHSELSRRKLNPFRSTIGKRRSPRDGVFWLHHAFVDLQWGHWLQKTNGEVPNPDATIKGDEIVPGKRVRDVLHTPQLGYVYGNGIYNAIRTKGQSDFHTELEKDMVLCAKLPGEERYYKLWVVNLSSVAAFITVQDFPGGIPGMRSPLWPTDTMYCDLRFRQLNVSADSGHLRITKSTSGSSTKYELYAKNGVEMAEFLGTTDFTADDGAGALDPEMLYI